MPAFPSGGNQGPSTFPRQSLKRFTFCVKSSNLIFLWFGVSPIVNLFDIKVNLFKPFTRKIMYNSLKN